MTLHVWSIHPFSYFWSSEREKEGNIQILLTNTHSENKKVEFNRMLCFSREFHNFKTHVIFIHFFFLFFFKRNKRKKR